MKFFPLKLNARERHARYWDQTPIRTADYTFTNLWGWAPEYGLEYSECDSLMWIRRTRKGNIPTDRFWAPLGDWENADWERILASVPAGTIWDRVPDLLCTKLLTLAPNRVTMEETRGQWEYLYERSRLETLTGNKLHKKKNHFNAYTKKYGCDYRTLNSNNIEHLLQFEYDWCRCHECDQSLSLQAENNAVIRVLTHWPYLDGLICGGLFFNDIMTAFTVGEALNDTTLVIHFEKGRPEYRGAYQAINALFARHAGADFEFINREQDAGEEGLRKAKEGYHPCGFIVKNRLIFS